MTEGEGGAAGGRRQGPRIGSAAAELGMWASRERLVGQSRRIEEMGFDSVWVRDHLIWHPHGMEGTDTTFIDPLLSLAAISSVTERIALGTAVLIPIRWPLSWRRAWRA